MADKTNIENFELDWKKVGENANADKLEAHAFGHKVELYRAWGDMVWCIRIDLRGTRGFESEDDAKQAANQKIRKRLKQRFEKATADLAAFNEAGLDFTELAEA